MSDDENRKKDRDLQIKIAQLTARLQVDLAWAIGLYAVSITLWVSGYQYQKEDSSVTIVLWVTAVVILIGAFGWMYWARECSKEFEKLKST
jgi:hypothetical protein